MRMESGVKEGEQEMVKRNVSGLSQEVPHLPLFLFKQVDVTRNH